MGPNAEMMTWMAQVHAYSIYYMHLLLQPLLNPCGALSGCDFCHMLPSVQHQTLAAKAMGFRRTGDPSGVLTILYLVRHSLVLESSLAETLLASTVRFCPMVSPCIALHKEAICLACALRNRCMWASILDTYADVLNFCFFCRPVSRILCPACQTYMKQLRSTKVHFPPCCGLLSCRPCINLEGLQMPLMSGEN